MRHVFTLCALAASLSACNPWPRFEALEPLPADERLGAPIYEGSGFRSTYIGASAKGDDVWVAVREGAGFDQALELQPASFTLLRVGARDLTVKASVAAPGDPADDFAFHLSTDPDGLVLVRTGDRPLGSVFSDGDWTNFDLPAGFDGTNDLFVSQAPGRVVHQRGQTGISVLDRREWLALTPPAQASAFQLVAWEGDTLRIVTLEDAAICTTTYSYQSQAEVGPHVCLDDVAVAALAPPSINGGPDTFQLAVTEVNAQSGVLRILSFADGQLHVGGQAFGTHLLHQPGSARVLLDVGNNFAGDYAAPTLTMVEAGQAEPAMLGFAAHLDCGCNRTEDPTCACHTRDLVMGSYSNGTGDAVFLLTLDDVDGRRTISLRRHGLPTFTDPFMGEPCPLTCGEEETCTLGYGGAPICVPTSGSVAAVLDATVVAHVETADPTDNTSITLYTAGLEHQVDDAGPDWRIKVAPNTSYQLLFEGPEYPSVVLEVQSPGSEEEIDLGSLILGRGERIKGISEEELYALAPTVATRDHAFVLPAAGQWFYVGGIDTLGVLQVVPMANAPLPGEGGGPIEAAVLSPDEQLAVAAGPEQTWILSLASKTPLGSIDAALRPRFATFARLENIFAIRDGGASAGDAVGAASLVDARYSVPSVRVRTPHEGRAEAVTPKGLHLLRVEGQEVVRYEITDGSRAVLGVVPDAPEGTHLRVSPDGAAALCLVPHDPLGGCPSAGCDASFVRDGAVVPLPGAVWASAVSATLPRAALLMAGDGGLLSLHLLDLETGALTPIEADGGLSAPLRAEVAGAVLAADETRARVLDATTGTLIFDSFGDFDAVWQTPDGGALLEERCLTGTDCDLFLAYPDLGFVRPIPRGADGHRFGLFDDRTYTFDDPGDSTLWMMDRDYDTGAVVGQRQASRGDPTARPLPLYDDARALGAPCLLYTVETADGLDLRCVY